MKGIILFGDSIFFGMGASKLRYSCGEVLKTLLSFPVLIRARVGDTTEDAIKRLEKDVLSQKEYYYVFILFGNNDCRLVDIDKSSVSLRDFKRNLKYIVRAIKLNEKVPIISNLHPIDTERFLKRYPETKNYIQKLEATPYEWHKKYSIVCEEVACEEKVFLLDMRSELEKDMESVIADDGIHLNNYGHKVIALKIFETLKKLEEK